MINKNIKGSNEDCPEIFDIFYDTDKKIIRDIELPNVLRFRRASKYDDKFINVNGNRWTFKYSGFRNVINFGKLHPLEEKIIKYTLVKYVQVNTASYLKNHFAHIVYFIKLLQRKNLHLDLKSSKSILRNIKQGSRYYSILFFLKQLFILEFSKFSFEKEFELELLERPNSYNTALFYQELQDTVDSQTKSLIQKGFLQLSKQIDTSAHIDKSTLKNSAILSIMFCSGLRPVQVNKLSVNDLKVDTYRQSDGFERYALLIPYAKQSRYTHQKIAIKIPNEVAKIILLYIKAFNLSGQDKLFNLGDNSARTCFHAINKQLLDFAPDQYKRDVKDGSVIQRKYTFTEFRHHVGHSLAMSGASAEEIANILGHSSTVTARHYIYSTPEISEVRARVLGKNPLYQHMIYMLMTGQVTSSKKWTGKRVVGSLGDKIFYNIGGCSYKDSCFLQPVRNCYGCLYFHPFLEGKHQEVYDTITNEVIEALELSDSVCNSTNPIIRVHQITKFEVQSVINRCKSVQVT